MYWYKYGTVTCQLPNKTQMHPRTPVDLYHRHGNPKHDHVVGKEGGRRICPSLTKTIFLSCPRKGGDATSRGTLSAAPTTVWVPERLQHGEGASSASKKAQTGSHVDFGHCLTRLWLRVNPSKTRAIGMCREAVPSRFRPTMATPENLRSHW